jgi:hypothetical protein
MNIIKSLNDAGLSFRRPPGKTTSENSSIYWVSDVMHIQGVLISPLEDGGPQISNSLLMASDNVPQRHIAEDSLNEYFETEKSLVLKKWMEITNLLFLKSLAMALDFVDGDEERLKSCVSMRMFICSSPKFNNLGLFSFGLRSKYSQMFPDEALPVVTSIGVSSLPKNAPISMDIMFKAAHK